MASFIESFLLAKRLGKKSRSDYARYLRDFDEFTGRTSLEDALTVDHAAAFKEKLAGVSIYTAHNGVSYLKSFAKWCAESGHLRNAIGTTVLTGLETPRPPEEGREPFTDEEVDHILAVLGERTNRDRARALAFAWLLLSCGLRRNEARCQPLIDVHFAEPRPYVFVRWINAKGKHKSRKARMDPDAAAAIDHYVQDERPALKGLRPNNDPRQDPLAAEPLFLTEHGYPFTDSGFGKWAGKVKDELEKAGVRAVTDWKPHRMRGTWATRYNRASRFTGTTFMDLKAEGGWSDDRTPQRYIKQRPWEELREMPTPLEALRANRRTA
jgi:site-specific recombinase XerD